MVARNVWILLALAVLSQQRPSPSVKTQEFRIRGIVQDRLSGAALDRAEVSIALQGVDGQEVFAPVVTSGGGHFAFDHVAAGKYILFAKRRGYAPQNYEQHETFTTGIAVGPQRDSENIVFRLLPQGTIAGQVIDQFGEPVRQAQVILFEEKLADGRISIRRQSQTQTDDQGRYRLGGLQKGRYYLVVSARPWYAQNRTTETMSEPDTARPLVQSGTVSVVVGGSRQPAERNASLDVVYPLTYYSGATDPGRASAINLEPGDAVEADFSLTAVPALHVRLTAPGVDLQQMSVSVSQMAFGDPVFVNANQLGQDSNSIWLGGVPPGEISVSAESRPDGKPAVSLHETLNARQGMEIDLNDRAGGVSVSGIVKAQASGRLPERTALILRDPETGKSSQALINADGSFDFVGGVSPGKYVPTLSVESASPWYVSAVQATGASASSRVVDLQTANPVVMTVEISNGLGRLEGVAIRDGKGIGGAMIALISNDLRDGASVVGRDQSDSDGTFAIANVPPGEYKVVAIQNGWDEQWADPSVLRKWLSGGEAVTIALNGSSRVEVNVQ